VFNNLPFLEKLYLSNNKVYSIYLFLNFNFFS